MNCSLFLLCVLFLGATFSSMAKGIDSSTVLPAFVIHSAIQNMELADSFSSAGDSINASRYYAAIDPFFFVSSGRTPETIEAGFEDYLLTRQTKVAYRRIFAKAYNTPRTVAYNRFKTMLAEDQAIRHKLSACADSTSCKAIERQMALTDSPHFEYLYAYVMKNGWPTYENGAMYAEIIAMHDIKYMQYYLPYLRRSVIAGNSSTRFFYNILNRARPSGIAQLRNYKQKLSFDISYVLKGYRASPSQIAALQKAVTDCGPIKHQYYLYESADKKNFTNFMNSTTREGNQNYWLAWDILVEINHAQHDNIPYSFLYSESTEQKMLTIVLVY